MKALSSTMAFVSAVLLLGSTTVTTVHAIGGMGLRSATSDISRNIRKQVRQALRPTLTINKKAKLPINGVAGNNSGRYMATLHQRSILVWDVQEGLLLSRIELQEKNPRSVVFSDNGEYLLVASSSGKLRQFPLFEEEGRFLQVKFASDASTAIYSSRIRQWLVGTEKGKLLAIDPATGKQTFSTAISNKAICCITALPSSEVAVATHSGEVQIVDVEKQGAFLDHWKAKSKIISLHWSNAEKKLVAVTSGKTYAFRPGSSEPEIFSASTAGMVATGVSQGSLYWFDDKELVVQSLDNGALKKVSMAEDISAMTGGMTIADKLLLATGDDGLLYGFKPGSKDLYLKWVVTKDGWTIVDQKGRFDGSAGGVKEIAWTAAGRSVGLDGFASSYYEPGLLKKLIGLDSQYFVKPAKGIGDGIFFPPEVSLDVDDQSGTVDIEVVAEGKTDDGLKDISRLYLYHNGKRISQKYQTGHEIDKNQKQVSWRYRLPLVKGDNSFYASVSAWSDIRSKSDTVSLNTSGQATDDTSNFVVSSIGINNYSSNGLLLNYSVADAKAVADKFTDEVGANKSRRIKSIILNDEARSSGIRKNLNKLKDLEPTDTAVMFLSGHGVAVDGKWYFLPQEATSLDNPSHIKQIGISGAELAEVIISSPAQKILLAVDACQSGAVLNDFQTFTQRKTLQKLSEDTGVHILTATRADQLAPEYEILGHGLFTYTLLKGLDKRNGIYNADRWPKDNNLTVGELKKYVLRYAPLLARKLNERSLAATAQRGSDDLEVLITPAQLTSGTDFKLN